MENFDADLSLGFVRVARVFEVHLMRHGELDADGVVKRVGLRGGEQRGPIVELTVPAEVVLAEPFAFHGL